MSQFDSMMAEAVPAALEVAGTSGALKYTLPDGSRTEVYDAILGQIRSTEEPDSTGGLSSLSSLVSVERQTASVIPKESHREIVDSGKVLVLQPGATELEHWYIDSITSATPSLITMELKRTLRKRGPESR